MKYLSIILLIALCSCNDGGSDPEFVKSKRTATDKAQQLHLDTAKNYPIAKVGSPIWIDTITIGGTTTIFDNDGNIIASIKAHSSCRNK